MVIFLLIVIIAILLRKQISDAIALIILGVICINVWDYWWGKIVVVIVGILAALAIIGAMIEKFSMNKREE